MQSEGTDREKGYGEGEEGGRAWRRLHVRVSEGRVGIVRAVGLKGGMVMQTPRLDLGRGGLATCKCPEQDSDPRGQTLVPATAAGSLPPPVAVTPPGRRPCPRRPRTGRDELPRGQPSRQPSPARAVHAQALRAPFPLAKFVAASRATSFYTPARDSA